MRGAHGIWIAATLAALGLARAAHPAPAITAFTPQSGPPGTLVKIIGAELADLTDVQFGGAFATSFRVVADNHVKAYVPEDAETGPVRVITNSGSAASATPFVVVRPLAPGPQLTFAPPRPNPARGPVSWSFTAPRPSRVRLALFDLRGRRVRVLVDEALPAGPHERVWDLLDSHGRRVRPGVYLARLEVEGRALARRVVLAR